MRLKVKTGINNCSLIDDSYSSDFQSLKIALDFLESQKQFQKRRLFFRIYFKAVNEELYSKVSQLIISITLAELSALEKPSRIQR
jgi:alanine racemase